MIKTIIFDFDKTMYVGDIGKVRQHERNIIEECFGHEVYEKFDEKYCVHKKDVKDIVEICRSEGLDYEKLVRRFNENMFQHKNRENVKTLPNEFFAELKQKHSLYIASMSPLHYLIHYLEYYKFDRKNFKDIVAMDLINDNSKADLFKRIMEREGNRTNEILMIGDNPIHDIQPALDLGMNAFLFQGEFNQIYDFMTENNILNCEKFKNL